MDKVGKAIADASNADFGCLVYCNPERVSGGQDNFEPRLPSEPFEFYCVKLTISTLVRGKEFVNRFADAAKY